MLDCEVIALQQEIEDETVSRGVDRYIERTQGKSTREGFDKIDEVQALIRGCVPLLSAALADWLQKASEAKGRKPTSFQALQALDLDVVAAIGTTSLFQNMEDGKVAAITNAIGHRIEIELEALALEAADPKAAKQLLKLAEGDVSATALESRFRRLVDQHEAALTWSDNTKALVGQTVLNVALIALEDVFETKTVYKGQTRHATVQLTEEAADALFEMQDAASLRHLPLRPMIVPPRKWEHMSSGAYLDFRLSRLVPMVRCRSKEQKRLVKEAIDAGQMTEVLTALNAIQDTRWAIDSRVLAVVSATAKAKGRPSKSFPAPAQPDLPPTIEPEVWEGMPKDERLARSRQRKALKLVRRAITNDKATFTQDLEEARHLDKYEAFFLPHSLDFRGRTYAVPYFNHQRSDHMKALFRFAEGLPLGPDGGKWLMIHLANCGDFEKVSKQPFATRLQWVHDNHAAIYATAQDPYAPEALWLQADSPFCFLQACFEYAEWADAGYSPDFLSSIPGAADGSCSGLQHYSCITRSKDEAYHVNLLPREDVGDIYRVTADVAVPTLQAAALGGDEAAETILANGFGRSEVKRNVMTYFYGSARFGMRDQHMQDLMQPLADKVAMGELKEHPYSLMTERTNKETGEVTKALDGGYTCAATMAAHVYAAVTTVAAKAEEAATFIQKLATCLAHEGKSMVWTTQTGFPVVQRYSEYTSKTVNIWLYDRNIMVPQSTDKVDQEGNNLARVQLLLRQAPTTRVDKKAMRNAASPNVIHSMDGAHLHRSVAMAAAAGIEAFSMIHDSFGTHMGHMEQFNGIIREALVSCYQDYCPLVELYKYAISVLSPEGIEKLPNLPERGELDLEDIRNSLYAFA